MNGLFSSSTSSKRNRYTQKRKHFAGLVTLTLMLIIAMLIGGIQSAEAFKPVEYKNFTVSTGDTVWEIASEVNQKHYDGKRDVRQLVYEISEVNMLENRVIQPGQELQIPIH